MFLRQNCDRYLNGYSGDQKKDDGRSDAWRKQISHSDSSAKTSILHHFGLEQKDEYLYN